MIVRRLPAEGVVRLEAIDSGRRLGTLEARETATALVVERLDVAEGCRASGVAARLRVELERLARARGVGVESAR